MTDTRKPYISSDPADYVLRPGPPDSIARMRAQAGARALSFVLAYVREHPGSMAREVISGHSGCSRREAELAIKELLYRTRELRSDHPASTKSFGRGQGRLWLAEEASQ